jgi:putative SOS response-associated peptidase YedK
MCCRYSLTAERRIIEERFQATFEGDYKPNYNAAPSQLLPIIINDNQKVITSAKFGLIPSWSKDGKTKYSMMNARAKTILEKKSYRPAMEKRRCLILADGYYEWQKVASKKQPYRITLKKGELFAMAGIWNSWTSPKGFTVLSFSIITTTANSITSKIHHRMPVILDPKQESVWLNTDTFSAINLLKSYPSSKMRMYKVSTDLGNVRNNFSQLLEEIS